MCAAERDGGRLRWRVSVEVDGHGAEDLRADHTAGGATGEAVIEIRGNWAVCSAEPESLWRVRVEADGRGTGRSPARAPGS